VKIDLQSGLDFLLELKSKLSTKESIIAKQMNSNPQAIDFDILRDLKRVTELTSSISDLTENPQKTDLSFFFQKDREKKSTKLVIQPFDIAYIFKSLFRGSKSLFMSATIGDGEYLAKLLGMDPNHCLYLRETSSFRKENHPFILVKEAKNLSTATPEKKKITFDFITRHTQPFLTSLYTKHQRGLILASSFELARLMEGIARASGLVVITHTAGKSDKAIKSFIDEERGDVLITPSGWEGISLDNDLARLCLIPKIPFPMMFDPIIQRKVQKYPQFLENDVLISIQQAHGRIQRNSDDWGMTICFDGNFRWLKNKRKKTLEPWFSNRILEVSTEEALNIFRTMIRKSNKRTQKGEKQLKGGNFTKMKKDDREGLQSSGLADLLTKKD
jgi:Rad3-related DNA helicase